jgi:hypothetical protein
MSSNNIGIGVANPKEKLHVNGGVLLGNSTSNNDGTIRWTGTDFQGRTDGDWVSLTSLGLKGDTGTQGVAGANGGNGAAGAKGASGVSGSKGEPGGADGFTFASASHDKPNGTMRFQDDLLQIKKNNKWYAVPLGQALDYTAPTGYSVSEFTVSGSTASITMAGAETGTALAYTISSSAGGTPVTGNVANIASATETVSGVPPAELDIVYAKAVPVSAAAIVNVALSPSRVNALTEYPVGAVPSCASTTKLSRVGVDGAIVSNSTVLVAALPAFAAVSSIDVSGLSNGTLTVSVTLTDAAANAGSAATKTVLFDTIAPSTPTLDNFVVEAHDGTAPTGYSVSAFTLDGDNATFTMAAAETGTALAYTISSSAGGTPDTVSVALAIFATFPVTGVPPAELDIVYAKAVPVSAPAIVIDAVEPLTVNSLTEYPVGAV